MWKKIKNVLLDNRNENENKGIEKNLENWCQTVPNGDKRGQTDTNRAKLGQMELNRTKLGQRGQNRVKRGQTVWLCLTMYDYIWMRGGEKEKYRKSKNHLKKKNYPFAKFFNTLKFFKQFKLFHMI